MKIYLFVIAALEIIQMSLAALSCLDENGSPVDRWTVFKAGYHTFDYYTYFNSSWTKSKYSLGQEVDGSLMRTMQQVYGSHEEIAVGMYSDQPPPDDTASDSYAHSKGVLAVTATQGFWLLHTMPHWPNDLNFSSPGPFPDDTYGQSIQCVTISSSTADSIAINLMINRPFVYSQNISAYLAQELPNFSLWLQHKYTTNPTESQTILTTLGGTEFVQMAKAKQWKKDLWDDMVAPYYSTSLHVETWRNGAGGRMSSICGDEVEPGVKPYEIIEVFTVTMPDGANWNGTQDHSKWGASRVSTSASSKRWSGLAAQNVVCLGDINRMCSQESRGGGALCLQDAGLWEAVNGIITVDETCWEYNPCTGSSTKCYWCPTNAPTSAPVIALPEDSVV